MQKILTILILNYSKMWYIIINKTLVKLHFIQNIKRIFSQKIYHFQFFAKIFAGEIKLIAIFRYIWKENVTCNKNNKIDTKPMWQLNIKN